MSGKGKWKKEKVTGRDVINKANEFSLFGLKNEC